jgi:hypothetical protein
MMATTTTTITPLTRRSLLQLGATAVLVLAIVHYLEPLLRHRGGG